MNKHHNIAQVAPPVATWVQVFWWGENTWIVARYDGEHWRDELGRIVRGPLLYWRER